MIIKFQIQQGKKSESFLWGGVGFYVAPTKYRSYGDFPAFLVQQDLKVPPFQGQTGI
jgi:hypothetical protein